MVGINQKEKVAEVRRSRPYHALVGVGLVSYGLLHLVMAWIALQLVFGKRGEASQQGALSQLARQPLGAGAAVDDGYRTFHTHRMAGSRGHDRSRSGRPRWPAPSSTEFRGASCGLSRSGRTRHRRRRRVGSGSGKGEETLSAKLMSVPFGQVLVAAVGAVVIAVGIAQIVKGVKQKFTEDLDRGVRPAIGGWAPLATASRA